MCVNPFDPFHRLFEITDPNTVSPDFLFFAFSAVFLMGASTAWMVARSFYYRMGKRDGLGMLRRGNFPNHL